MSAAERTELHERAQSERICGTYYVRLSGEMVTPAAPLTRTEWSRVKQFGVAALSAGALAVVAGCVSTPDKHVSLPPPAHQAVAERAIVQVDKTPAAPCSTPTDKPPVAVEKKNEKEEDEVILLTGFMVNTTRDGRYIPARDTVRKR